MAKTPTQYAKILLELLDDIPEKKYDETMKIFVSFLAKEQALRKAPEIIKEVTRLSKLKEGIVPVIISTAVKRTQADLEKIAKQFVSHPEITAVVDESLLGGVRVEMEGVTFDGSLKAQSSMLHTILTA